MENAVGNALAFLRKDLRHRQLQVAHRDAAIARDANVQQVYIEAREALRHRTRRITKRGDDSRDGNVFGPIAQRGAGAASHRLYSIGCQPSALFERRDYAQVSSSTAFRNWVGGK